MTSDRPQIVVVAPRVVGTFIRQDADLLAEIGDTTVISVRGLSDLGRLCKSIRRADVVILWFLGRHAVPAVALARARQVPVIAIIGGFEVAWDAATRYGIKPNSLRESVLRWLLQRAVAIVTVSQFSDRMAKRRLPALAHRMITIHNAVDTSRFMYRPGEARRGALCVASLTRSSIKIKNLELYRDVAAAMPDTPFALVGPAIDDDARRFVTTLPTNLTWTGALDGEALVNIYCRSSVYAQLSRHESFSLALAEAMACGCVPVVSDCGALPEVGGTAAHMVSDLSVDSVKQAIGKALLAGESERNVARKHVVAAFGIDTRKRKLSELIQRVLTRSSGALDGTVPENR